LVRNFATAATERTRSAATAISQKLQGADKATIITAFMEGATLTEKGAVKKAESG